MGSLAVHSVPDNMQLLVTIMRSKLQNRLRMTEQQDTVSPARLAYHTRRANRATLSLDTRNSRTLPNAFTPQLPIAQPVSGAGTERNPTEANEASSPPQTSRAERRTLPLESGTAPTTLEHPLAALRAPSKGRPAGNSLL